MEAAHIGIAFLIESEFSPLLFFFLGVVAVFVGSDLDVPAAIARFLSLYLLMAIGFKGGVASGSGSNVSFTVSSAWLLPLVNAMLACVVATTRRKRMACRY